MVVVAKEYAVFFVYRAFRATCLILSSPAEKKQTIVWLVSPAVAYGGLFLSFWKVDDAVAAARAAMASRH